MWRLKVKLAQNCEVHYLGVYGSIENPVGQKRLKPTHAVVVTIISLYILCCISIFNSLSQFCIGLLHIFLGSSELFSGLLFP